MKWGLGGLKSLIKVKKNDQYCLNELHRVSGANNISRDSGKGCSYELHIKGSGVMVMLKVLGITNTGTRQHWVFMCGNSRKKILISI